VETITTGLAVLALSVFASSTGQAADAGGTRMPDPVGVDAGETANAPVKVAIVDTRAKAVFPIRGRHDLGEGATNRFGGGRGHQGQDMFAACGTPLVAALDAKVQHKGFQSSAGHYLVLQDAAGRSYAYMHMRKPALVKKGQRVDAGQPVGAVGQTGRAQGCHLHFEIWTAPGWYAGGHAIDPRPQLERWDLRHKHR
jgi:murein DD-endopeptidase MepM/ murein hydrolase activator NlpD